MVTPVNKPSFASLSSGLLARKGQARPAMRPGGLIGHASLSDAMDDLGWNDMGDAPKPEAAATVVPVAQDVMPAAAPLVPPVLRQRAALIEEIAVTTAVVADPPASEVPSVVEVPGLPAAAPTLTPPPAARVTATARKTKAAFTLRLDPARHLRLRLAAALTGRSAQALVTDALDRFLADMPGLDDMARRLPDPTEEGMIR